MTSTASLIGYLEPGSPEWHEARIGGLGGSEIAAAMQLSHWESPFSLWHRKAGVIGPVQETSEMEWGKRLEPVIADKFAECHPELVVTKTGLWRNRERSYQLGQPDRICYERIDAERHRADGPLLEIKVARWDEHWGDPGTDDIPVGYKAQVQWYMDCLGRERCYVAVLIAPSDYREYLVEYSAEDAATMRRAAEEFLSTIDRDERPPIDGSSATYMAIREMHPEIEPRDHRVPNELAVSYLQAVAAAKVADEEKRRQVNLLADEMGTARRALWDKECIATRMSKNGGTPYVKVANFAADRLEKTA